MPAALVWFRRDLRVQDHAALHHALRDFERVHCVFVFDTTILDRLPRRDRRVEFILRAVEEVDAALRAMGGGLIVRHGDPRQEIPRLAAELGVAAVFANRDYEPAAVARDQDIGTPLEASDILLDRLQGPGDLRARRDHDQGGTPFSVFTPYKNAWLKALTPATCSPGRSRR
jgi:deoxyribodipyrimidine photo-lyase